MTKHELIHVHHERAAERVLWALHNQRLLLVIDENESSAAHQWAIEYRACVERSLVSAELSSSFASQAERVHGSVFPGVSQ